MHKTYGLNIKFSLPVTFLKEGKYFVAYTPALDLSTYGKTFDETKRRFEEVVRIFFKEIVGKGTLDNVLSDLGWKKMQKGWIPPLVVTHESQTFNLPLSV